VATKLHLPRLQPGFVPRRRLLDRLEAAPAGQLVLVCAPAGFGKTALLGDWAGQRRRAVGWLSLDEGDNDPARFWRHVVAALDRVRPGVAGEVAPLLGPPAPPSFEGLVSALINELAAQSDRVVLVLDDYHLIQAHQVHGALEFLLEHLPPGLQLVVASRTDPPLPLARLRARGRLAEVRERDLRFTAEEAAALLRGAVGPDLPEAAVAALTARTEGWVAGLQLAGLSLRGHADPAGFVATFSGSHRHVLDYLAEEVLDRQPQDLRAFLLETSILERLSGPLCDAVTGRPDSQALLERAERANLFLQPLDEVRGWGATTSCSPTCSKPACGSSGRTGAPSCTGPRPPGTSSTDRPTPPCATPWLPATRSGPRGWSSGTSKRCTAAARSPRSSGGSRSCPPR
jgi:ATP/maltotriose-dependent transcriptional regulator MalT